MKNPFEDGKVVRAAKHMHPLDEEHAAMVHRRLLTCSPDRVLLLVLCLREQVGITNYIDVGLRLAAPLARERAAAAAGGAP